MRYIFITAWYNKQQKHHLTKYMCVIEWLSITAFEAHVIHLSHVIIAYALEILSKRTEIVKTPIQLTC